MELSEECQYLKAEQRKKRDGKETGETSERDENWKDYTGGDSLKGRMGNEGSMVSEMQERSWCI